jgi:hypothetical protein
MIQLERDKYCADCFYFNPTVSAEYSDGYCRRYAPTQDLVLTTEPRVYTDQEAKWPHVDRRDWCGDFRDKGK